MENIDETITQLDAGQSPDNEKLNAFVKGALQQIKKINGAYKRLFESHDGKETVVAEIEKSLLGIKTEYENLFTADTASVSKIAELNTKYEEIKKYHSELITDDKSIAADIADSQEKITEFYVELFGGADGTTGKEEELKKAIEKIVSFHVELTKENGYEVEVENAHKKITELYSDLFEAKTGEVSKFSELEKGMGDISIFKGKIDSELTPFLEGKKTAITEIAGDITQKQREINSLLSGATVKTLAQGYLESMQRYGFIGIKIASKDGTDGAITRHDIYNFAVFSLRWVMNSVTSILNYALFISPLLLIAAIFIEPTALKTFFSIESLGGNNLLGTDFIFYKISVSIPLLWVSWLGQRNISQRKRMFEEYNHKLRVVQMYLHFMTTSTYKLSDKTRLEEILLKVIDRNPTEVYGKDDTMLDKIIELVKVSKGIAKDAVDVVKQQPTGV